MSSHQDTNRHNTNLDLRDMQADMEDMFPGGKNRKRIAREIKQARRQMRQTRPRRKPKGEF